jgi:hypothetical protein
MTPLPTRRPSRQAGDLVNVAAKLAGFAGVLALIFAAAAFAGSRIDAHPGRPAAAPPGMAAKAGQE